MMRNLLRAFSLVAVMTLAGFSAQADVSGKWVFAVTLGDLGSGNADVTLVEEAEGKLSGTYAGQLANGPVTGTFDGDKFEFSFNSELLGGAITYRGERQADGTVKGSVVVQGQDIGTFTGKQP